MTLSRLGYLCWLAVGVFCVAFAVFASTGCARKDANRAFRVSCPGADPIDVTYDSDRMYGWVNAEGKEVRFPNTCMWTQK